MTAALAALILLAVAPTEADDFFNPVAPDGADPWVTRGPGGRYYGCVTTGGDVTLFRSASLSGLFAGERKTVWRAPPKGPNSKGIWAPELHRLRGRWYVYVAADDGDNANHRMFVLENPAADPFDGRFAEKGRLAAPGADRWAIDGAPFEHAGRLYFVWSGWEGTVDVRQLLYVAPMSDPWTLSGPRVEICRPTFDWERAGGPPSVNEGPQPLAHNGALHVVYSAAGSWTDHYCLGMLTLTPGGDPLDPSAWRKRPSPVFAGANGVVAPGHGCFTTSPDGREWWHVYHAAKAPGSGWSREVRMQPFSWGADGAPEFGRPAPGDAPLRLPSGEAPRRRLPVGARLAAGESANAALTADAAGVHSLMIRCANRDPKEPATLALELNGKSAGAVSVPPTVAGGWTNILARLTLAAGANRLTLTAPGRVVEVTGVDVVR